MTTDDALRPTEDQNVITHWVDIYSFPVLVGRLVDLDRPLGLLFDELSARMGDPDFLLEEIADLVGEGLHRCQLYMRERIGRRLRTNALQCGPRVGARYVAEVIWAAANYWKHQAEWPIVGRLSKQQESTLKVFRDTGITEDEYWLAHLLHVLSPEHTALAPVADQLLLWRDAFDRESEIDRRRSERRRRERGERFKR